MNDALRQMALEEGATIAEPGILAFHEEVLHSIAAIRAHRDLEELPFSYPNGTDAELSMRLSCRDDSEKSQPFT